MTETLTVRELVREPEPRLHFVTGDVGIAGTVTGTQAPSVA